MQIGLSPTSPTGVVMAPYSSKYSRMWAWDVDTQEILGFQDVRGRAELLDVSEDGRYCGWIVDAKGNYDTHIGVSRPYSFHALFWRRAVSVLGYGIRFHGNEIQYFSTPLDYQLGEEVERVQPGCPLVLKELQRSEQNHIGPSPRVIEDHIPRKALIDRRGRTIELTRTAVLSDGNPLLDLARPEFTAIPHPEWAKGW